MGEIHLLETILESENPHELLKKVLNEGFEFFRLENYSVIKDGVWMSTEESTVSCPVIYLKKEEESLIIVKRPEDEKYKLSTYHITL
ncbi:MAG: hypothetical protein ABH804_01940 [archaeon]